MSSSHSCSGASTSVGCGWPSVAGRNRSAAYAVGSGGEETCRLLWMRTPQQYRGGLCYTAFWAACVVVLPEGSTGRRGRADLPSGALHHRPAPAGGLVGAMHASVFQERGDAQGLLTSVPAPAQPSHWASARKNQALLVHYRIEVGVARVGVARVGVARVGLTASDGRASGDPQRGRRQPNLATPRVLDRRGAVGLRVFERDRR